MPFIFVTLEVSKLAGRVKEAKGLANIKLISLTLEVSKLAGRAKEVMVMP